MDYSVAYTKAYNTALKGMVAQNALCDIRSWQLLVLGLGGCRTAQSE
jgi:hypothetical protein